MLRGRGDPDAGSILPMVIGFTVIAVLLVIVGVDVTAVFLARRALASAADAAAVAAAQGIDTARLYAGAGPQCGRPLPLDADRAAALAAGAARDAAPGLRRTFTDLRGPATAMTADGVSVTLSGDVTPPFGAVLGWLDPSRPDGRVHVSETSTAHAPVAGGGC